MSALRNPGRVVGLWYLSLVLIGPLTLLYIPNKLFVHGDAHSLVELAKKETDPEMRKRLVEKLSVMGNKEATDYLMQLLEK